MSEIINIEDMNLLEAINRELGFKKESESTKPVTIDEMKELITLDAIDCNIESLVGLEYAINLNRLRLTCNDIQNINPIANLTELTELLIDDNLIKDISPLKSLINLNHLDLNSNEIKDISPLRYLHNLKYLHLMDNEIKDLSTIKTMNNLKLLSLAENMISDFSEIRLLMQESDLLLDSSAQNIEASNFCNTKLVTHNNELVNIEPNLDNVNIECNGIVLPFEKTPGNNVNDCFFNGDIFIPIIDD